MLDAIQERRPRFFPLKAESQELLHLDALRLLAALAIVVLHFRTNLLAALPDPQTTFRRLDGLAVGVDLFFVISGFVITWVYRDTIASREQYGRFLRKRMARLVPLHWATLAFFVAVGLVAMATDTSLTKAGKYDFSCLVPNLLLLHAWGICQGPSFNTVSWSISAEMALYLAFPLLFAALRRRPELFAGAVLLLLVLLESGLGSPFWVERTYAGGIVRAVPGFCVGMMLYHWREALGRLPGSRALLAATLALFAGGLLAGWSKGVLVLLAYLVGALGVAADMRGKASPAVHHLAPLGRLTYSAYMLHPVVQSLFIVLLGRGLLRLDGWPLTLWSVLAIGVALALSYASLCLFEEPLRRRLSRPLRRGSARYQG